MPLIRISAMTAEQIQKLSLTLPQELAPLMSTDVDNFTLQRIESQYFQKGVTVVETPLLEIFWFDRGPEVQNRTALKITEVVRQLGSFDTVTVVFTAWAKTAYYENGKHF